MHDPTVRELVTGPGVERADHGLHTQSDNNCAHFFFGVFFCFFVWVYRAEVVVVVVVGFSRTG